MNNHQTWYSGRQYDLSKGEDILALQEKLQGAQDRGAVNDAAAIGHTLAVGCATLAETLSAIEKPRELSTRETVLQGASHPGTKMRVLESPAGFYLGFNDENGCPYSRESNYFRTRQLAQMVLDELRIGKVFDYE